MKVLLDTNILIDLLDDKRENFLQAKKLYENLRKNNDTIFITDDILTNFYYNTSNKNKNLAVSFINDLCQSKTFDILSFSKRSIQNACKYYLSNAKIDFEDALQYFCALENGCEAIYTNDKSSFPKLDIPLYDSNNNLFYLPKK